MTQMTAQEATALIAKLEQLTANPPQDVLADSSIRRRLREAAKNFSIALEMPGDTVHRIGNTALQSSMARVGTDVKLFEILAESDRPMGSDELAEKTGMEPNLMKRFLRYYQSMRMLAQVGDDEYAANNVSRALTPPGGIGVEYIMGVLNPVFEALPEYLRTHNYREITNPTDSPFQLGHQETAHPFVWIQSQPHKFELFLKWMAYNRDGLPSWLETYPFAEEVGDTTYKNILFVDIGSAGGHQSTELRERFPNLHGRIVMQDLEHVISAVKPPQGIEPMVYDFNTPQPIQGARCYYMRMILHDYPDEQCRKILHNTMSAMTKESILLIDEIVLPEVGAAWRAAQMDMTMLTSLAGKERSQKEWYALLESVGLHVVKVWKYTEECKDCIIVAKSEVCEECLCVRSCMPRFLMDMEYCIKFM